MASIKFHVFRGDNDGTESCDFRGEGFIGEEQGDHHRTIPQLEIDPASDELVEAVLEYGPAANDLFSAIREHQPDQLAQLATLLGLEGSGPVGVRVGVWDE